MLWFFGFDSVFICAHDGGGRPNVFIGHLHLYVHGKRTQEAGARPAPETASRHFRRRQSAQLAWHLTIFAAHCQHWLLSTFFIILTLSCHVGSRVFATVHW